jgi:hypothetical protein
MPHLRVASGATQLVPQQRVVLVAVAVAPANQVLRQDRLGLVEDVLGDDSLVFAFVDLGLVAELADVDDVANYVMERRLGEGIASEDPAVPSDPLFGAPPAPVELGGYL